MVALIRVAQLLYSDTVMRGADTLIVDLAREQLRDGGVRPLIVAAAGPQYARLLATRGVPHRLLPFVHPNRLNYLRVYAALLRRPPGTDVVHAKIRNHVFTARLRVP